MPSFGGSLLFHQLLTSGSTFLFKEVGLWTYFLAYRGASAFLGVASTRFTPCQELIHHKASFTPSGTCEKMNADLGYPKGPLVSYMGGLEESVAV